jgi:hypothetical protein
MPPANKQHRSQVQFAQEAGRGGEQAREHCS